MASIRLSPNKTLKGHKLAILLGVTGPPKMLLGETLQAEEIAELKSRFPDLDIVTVEGVALDSEELRLKWKDEDWKDVTILVTGSALPEVGQAPRLEYVQLQTAGANHLFSHPLFRKTDVAFCTASGVHGYVLEQHADQIQIHTGVLTEAADRKSRLDQYTDLQRQKLWRKLDHPEQDLLSQRVGIIGYGSVGRQVARVSTALGMDVHVCTLHQRATLESRRHDSYTPAGLGDTDGTFPSKWFSADTTRGFHEFLGTGLDLLVITVPLTDRTRGLISRRELEILAGAFVSNVSRGAVVNAEDLVYALEHDIIRGAAIDVTDPEPLPDSHPLWTAKNLLITPHISGGSSAYAHRVFEVLKHNLVLLSEGKVLTNKVNSAEGY